MNASISRRIEVLLARFDIEDKGDLARQLVDLLEVGQTETIRQKAKEALDRRLSSEETFRLDTLSRIGKDRDLVSEGSLPDWSSVGAPKGGL